MAVVEDRPSDREVAGCWGGGGQMPRWQQRRPDAEVETGETRPEGRVRWGVAPDVLRPGGVLRGKIGCDGPYSPTRRLPKALVN